MLDHNPKTENTISLNDLGKTIEQRWNNLSITERKEYEVLSTIDTDRYRNEMKLHNIDNTNTTQKKTIRARRTCRSHVTDHERETKDEKEKQSVGKKGNSYHYDHHQTIEQSTTPPRKHQQKRLEEDEVVVTYNNHRSCGNNNNRRCLSPQKENSNNDVVTPAHSRDVKKKKKQKKSSLSPTPITPCSQNDNNHLKKEDIHLFFIKSNDRNELKFPTSYHNSTTSTTSYETVNPIPYRKRVVSDDTTTTSWEHHQHESSSRIMYHDGRRIPYHNQYSECYNHNYYSYDPSYYPPYSNRRMSHNDIESPVQLSAPVPLATVSAVKLVDDPVCNHKYNHDDNNETHNYYHNIMKPITEVLYAPIVNMDHLYNTLLPIHAKEIDSKYIPTLLTGGGIENNMITTTKTQDDVPMKQNHHHPNNYYTNLNDNNEHRHHQEQRYNMKYKYYIMNRKDATKFITNLHSQHPKMSSSFI